MFSRTILRSRKQINQYQQYANELCCNECVCQIIIVDLEGLMLTFDRQPAQKGLVGQGT